MSVILGISAFYHDSAACIVREGEIVAAAQQERFSRVKHDERFPEDAIRYCLDACGIGPDDLSYVAYYEKPLLKFDRLLETYLAFAPKGFPSFKKAIPVWLKQKLFLENHIRSGPLKAYSGPIVYPEHHEAHAASAFYPSPFESAAVVTVDGVGEWATTTIGRGNGNELEMLEQINFPHSIGLLYSAFTYFCGFKVNSGEYKLMGLAPYGEPEFYEIIRSELIELKADGSYRLNLKYFDYPVGLKMTSRRFSKLFGIEPRLSESPIQRIHMNLAASVQKVVEEAILNIVSHARELTGENRLCLAGGVALNCVANGKIARSGIFDDIWIQPASGDAGGSLGAACFTWHQLMKKPRSVSKHDLQKSSLLGPDYSNEAIQEVLERHGASWEYFESPDLQAERIAEYIQLGSVVGVHSGKMEFGPRALGSRSILADPRSPEMQRNLNLKIKFRESFRPFAPSVMEEHTSDFFDLGCSELSPYMLLVSDVEESQKVKLPAESSALEGFEKLSLVRSTVPAITHVDNSARVQTVGRRQHPFFHAILSAFYEKTGCPMLINTSFNVRGEPIVCTPEDAYQCFMNTDMDVLSVGSFMLEKTQQDQSSQENSRSAYLEQFQLD
jgi:carbamoyltransferase